MSAPPGAGLRRAASSRALVAGILVLAWGLRLCCIDSVPPGWRDDELINMFALSGKVLDGEYPLYFTGASGHEPLYHYLHAAVLAGFGFNALGGVLLSAALGVLSVALAYVVARRLFGPVAAVLCALMLSASFWSLMYSRTAIRHVSLLPFALAFLYWYVRHLEGFRGSEGGLAGGELRRTAALGVLLGLSVYTYAGARLLFLVPVAMAAYLGLAHPGRLKGHWRWTTGLVLTGLVVAAPLAIAIAGGFSEQAAEGIGAEGRLFELAVPVRELLAGNAEPMLEGALTTLGMFHATGDPEWLYNIPGRPVFGLLGGLLMWAGVVRCLAGWRDSRRVLALLWLVLGLVPGFAFVPPASLGHTILAQPVVYMLVADTLVWVFGGALGFASRLPRRSAAVAARAIVTSLAVALVLAIVVRDLGDYFLVWPEDGMVGLLYRADYREAATFLAQRADIADAAVASALRGPWDRLALQVDAGRDDLAIRLFNPERALVWAAGQGTTPVVLTEWPSAEPLISGLLDEYGSPDQVISERVSVVSLGALSGLEASAERPLARFANGLALLGLRRLDAGTEAGSAVSLLCTWLIENGPQLPPIPIVANPPPPGVYSGARLSVFVHVVDPEGQSAAGDDGLWVDPVTLRQGDYFVQAHVLEVPAGLALERCLLEVGLYDPKTGERWPAFDPDGGALGDSLLLPITGAETEP
jgi:4-amino-4-deoxy-L-arabinose transferase-like glycosyltransferase